MTVECSPPCETYFQKSHWQKVVVANLDEVMTCTADCSDPLKVKPLIKTLVSPWMRRWAPVPAIVQLCNGHTIVISLPISATSPLFFVMTKGQSTR
jgi:hypothetical protein